jgi:hypothetical protein
VTPRMMCVLPKYFSASRMLTAAMRSRPPPVGFRHSGPSAPRFIVPAKVGRPAGRARSRGHASRPLRNVSNRRRDFRVAVEKTLQAYVLDGN